MIKSKNNIKNDQGFKYSDLIIGIKWMIGSILIIYYGYDFTCGIVISGILKGCTTFSEG